MSTLAAILLAASTLPGVAQLPPADSAMLLPLQDRHGDAALAQYVNEALQAELGRNLQLVETTGLRDELRRLRLRDAGDIDPSDLRRLAETFGVQWLISVTLHDANETPEPQFVISAWAHRVKDDNLAWAGFESAAGLSTERSLGRDRIELLENLAAATIRRLIADLGDSLEGKRGTAPRAADDDEGFLLRPVTVPDLGAVAVIPFESVTGASPAESGELITALARATLHRHGATLLHPGRVNAILRRRGVFMRGELDPLARAALRIGGAAVHILTGMVAIYESPRSIEPNPHVEFSARLVEVDSGRIVWISGQERTGWDRPGMFGRDKVYDAGTLATSMMESLVTGFLEPPQR